MNSPNLDTPLSRISRGKAKLVDDDRGGLGVIDTVDVVPFAPVRMFWIADVARGTIRGGHAHKLCSQFLVCLQGRIKVDAFDGTLTQQFVLERGDFLNLVPGIFATETFLDDGCVLLALCDRPYEAEDYIVDRASLMPGSGH
ncbi:FdtA/QdtA family cupin domain-containing protein [Bradyrhizobium sp. LjRoot220]|uniref:sugar 3,4-ketoisomerase n=1 Tax=Bradyrhizobium sp. LjRoot220 TaxID=3342284 RepID=UPI003ECD921B